jgi:hypothetical protein
MATPPAIQCVLEAQSVTGGVAVEYCNRYV